MLITKITIAASKQSNNKLRLGFWALPLGLGIIIKSMLAKINSYA
jgi:hypothetical protein